MEAEEVRLRALLSIRTNDKKYIEDVPEYMQIFGLYPENVGQSKEDKIEEDKKLDELKETLDKTYK